MTVPDELAGKRGRCRACGATIQVPAVAVDDQIGEWLAGPVAPVLDAIVDDVQAAEPVSAPVAVATPPPLPITPVAAPAVDASNPPAEPEQLLERVRRLERSLRRHRIVSALLIGSWVLLIGAVFGMILLARLMYPDPLKAQPFDGPNAGVQSDEESRLGGNLITASLTAATHKVDGTGGARWLSRLSRDEWEALMLTKLRSAAHFGDASRLVYEGFVDELPSLIALLEQGVRTPAAERAALSLRRIIARAKSGYKPFQTCPWEDRWIDGDAEEGNRMCEEVGKELAAIEQELDRDLDVYFARRWGR